jgi:hypothetical protein
MVSLIERDHANVSFCSNHYLGTALPPPSVGGLRPNSPVTCGFSASHPAPSRRPCAVGAGTTRFPGRARARAKARGRDLPPSEDVQFVPVLTSSARLAGVLRQAFGRDRIRRAIRVRAVSPSRCLCWRLVFVPRAFRCAWSPSSPSSPPMRCPGSGLQCSRRFSASKPLRSPRAIARDHGVSASGRRWRSCLRRQGIPAGESSAETWPSLPVQRHPRGSNRVGEGGRANEELSGIAGGDRRSGGTLH